MGQFMIFGALMNLLIIGAVVYVVWKLGKNSLKNK
ncbi:hypothetical protein U719_07880 [Exiguobacterium sp. MH3]|nr:hypothetical protein U719_07880 [Exiguobacterium sp. MH3]